MAAVALAITFVGGLAFLLLIVIAAVVLFWEWSRMVRGVSFDAATFAGSAAIVLALVTSYFGNFGLAVGILALGVAAVVLTGGGNRPLLTAFGVPYLGLPALAVSGIRADDTHGLAAMCLMLLVVWGTDTGAYLTGRTIGGPKLWPAVSPKKTWAGFIGGVLAGGLAAVVWGLSFGTPHMAVIVMLGAGLAVANHLGDLLESQFKRSLNVKDTSSLIPGHGGLLDRVDGLLFVSIAVLALGLIRGLPSAQALIDWSSS